MSGAGRRLVVEADGGSRGNPGVAGYGALVRDAVTGALLAERAEPIGMASNNVAEYRGLIAGLIAATRIDPGACVQVRMDSKLVVEQMSGRWKIKHEDMRRLALEARDLVQGFVASGGSVTFTWIPRAENSAADALSNTGMDGTVVDHVFTADTLVDEALRPEAAAPAEAGSARHTSAAIGHGTPTRIILVRHGITDFTAQARLDGRGGPDPDLNDVGRAQAQAAARNVAALVGQGGARVITSSLARARQTGAAVAAAIGAEALIDPEWDEQNFGAWDGESIPDLIASRPDQMAKLRDDVDFAPAGGESHNDLVARVVPAWRRVLAEGGTTVVVAHRKPIMVVLAHVLDIEHTKAWMLAIAPASLTAIEVFPTGEISVAFTNRT